MIDTHAHIYDIQFKEDIDEVIDQSRQLGVNRILMPNIDLDSIDAMLVLADQYPEYCLPMMGLHPCSVDQDFEKAIEIIDHWLSGRSFYAVGEMGTDLYWDKTFWPQQQEAFEIQCELGLKYDLPIVIHSRDSIDETIDLVAPYAERGLRGVFHCFTGSVEQGQKIQALGFYLGIGGVVTFKNGGLDKVLPELGLDKLVLETDSPYLAPTPHRGKRNSPTFLPLICQKIADILQISVLKVSQQTDLNAQTLFRLDEL
jgi:TatD DNase family protein